MKRSHEEISRKSFNLWISARGSFEHVSWTDVAQANEPPDWFLDIGQNRYAVEATSIVDAVHELGIKTTSASISSALHYLVAEVESEARDRGFLHGAYLVELAPLPNFRKNRKWLRDVLLKYVEETAGVDMPDPKEFGKVGNSNISIRKLHADRDHIAEMISYGVKSGNEATIDLQKLLESTLTRKAQLLQRQNKPVILLILDSFGYSHIADWKNAFAQLRIPSLFHTICRVKPGKPAVVLFSREDSWLA